MSATVLRKIQTQLQSIYELDLTDDVNDYVISDARLAALYDNGSLARDVPEKLLIQQQDNELRVALYLDHALLQSLQEDDPTRRLHEHNLADYCTALEGISHFLYVLHNAGHDRPVSLFELELQAEVDKFISSLFWLSRQRAGRVPGNLHPRLFHNVCFDTRLDHSEGRRYRQANRYASRYCRRLERRFLRDRRPNLLGEIRRFYRLTQGKKLKRIRGESVCP